MNLPILIGAIAYTIAWAIFLHIAKNKNRPP